MGAKDWAYLLIPISPLVTIIIQRIVFKIDWKEARNIYSGVLLLDAFFYLLYKIIIYHSYVETILNNYKSNPFIYLISTLILNVFLSLFREYKEEINAESEANDQEEERSQEKCILEDSTYNQDKNMENKENTENTEEDNTNKENEESDNKETVKEDNEVEKSCFLTKPQYLIFFAYFFLSLSYFIEFNFGHVEPDQLIFHLTAKLDSHSNEYVFSFIKICFIYAPIIAFITYKLLCYMPDFYRIGNFTFGVKKTLMTFIFLIVSIYIIVLQTSLYKLFATKGHFFENNYVDPNETKLIWPEKQRNLIFIGIESMESTFSSKEYGGFYNENFIPNLTQIALNNIHFSNTDKLGGSPRTELAHWSIAGFLSYFGGIPIKWAHKGKAASGLVPGATTVLDLLRQRGYDEYLLIPHYDAYQFGTFFKGHGNAKLYDLPVIKKALEQYTNVTFDRWGLPDYVLYEMAAKLLEERINNSKPFMMTIATLDTHFENGIKCPKCIDNHDYQYYDVMQCTDRQAGKFFEYLKTLPYYNDTTIIMIGDHLTMSKRIIQETKPYDRRTYNAFINSVAQPQNKSIIRFRKFLQYDMFPTILASLGVKIKGERLGLGTNLFSGQKTLSEMHGYSFCNKNVPYESDYYTYKFWLVPEGVNVQCSIKWFLTPQSFNRTK